MLSKDGGAVDDVIAHIRKADAAFVHRCAVWRARETALGTKMRIFSNELGGLTFERNGVQHTQHLKPIYIIRILKCLMGIDNLHL